MKPSIILLTSAIVFTIFTFQSCTKTQNNFVPSCSGTAKTFSGDAFPIIQSACLSCHTSSLNNYANVAARASSIRSKIIDGSMPQSGSLSSTQKNAIICWIDNGALNN